MCENKSLVTTLKIDKILVQYYGCEIQATGVILCPRNQTIVLYEGSDWMNHELDMLVGESLCEEEVDDFIAFLHFCLERLNKGEQVQAIWNDYLKSVGRR